MSKYNVGDVVKLRDDLEEYIEYGEMDYNKEMDRMKNKPIKLLRESNSFGNCYEVEDETGEGWFLSDEMIEGLWEECKPKLKLIDVLNMIARGELKEGTKVKYDEFEYTYKKNEIDAEFLERNNWRGKTVDILEDIHLGGLNAEVELIEPPCEHEWKNYEKHRIGVGLIRKGKRCKKCGLEEEQDHFADAGKMEKIEELSELIYAHQTDTQRIATIFDKLNEVIRIVNKE